MDSCLISLGLYLVLSVVVLVLKRLADSSMRRERQRRGEDLAGAGYGTNGAWSELDTYIARSQGQRPLQ